MEIVTTVGGALLAPAFESLFNQLTSPEVLRFARKKHVETELNKWKEMLERIYGVLEDAEEKQTMTRSVKMWVSQLRDLAYDVEDILDEFDFEVRRSKLKAERVGRRMFKVRKLLAKMNLKAIKSNIQMMSKIKGVTARLQEIASQKNQLGLIEVATGRTGGTMGEGRATSPLVNTAEVYGREEDKEAILQLLNNESSNEGAHLTVIGIVGMGGVGKTTLAKLIFDEAKKEFDVSAWISVGEDFNVVRLTKSILRWIDARAPFSENDDLSKLQVMLKEKLSGKKFLIVLDDVWNEKYEDWTHFRHPLENGARTSRIILTTRTLAISQMMDAVESYPLNQLTTDESLCLLALHAFGKPNFHDFEDLEDLGNRIVERCGCLPLAVKALGGLLKAKPTRSAWENVLKSGIWNEKSHILPSMRLSYHYLAPHLKRCFAYCAIFPKDYEFDHKELVKLWMAEGFLQPSSHSTQNRMQLGYEYFEDLLLRSLFQESSTDGSKYVMHDLVNDLSRFINEEMCLNLDDMSMASITHAKVRHLAFSARSADNYQRFEGLDKMSNLRTFLALYTYSSIDIWADKVVHKLVLNWKRLRVLSLVGYRLDELPSSIGVLKHLRDLDLSYAQIKKLPQSLGNLINLETLNLHGCRYLKKLPAGIGNLINLIQLDLEDTNSLVELPIEMANLKNLEKLFVDYYGGKIFPSWIGDPTLANMIDLTLCSCPNTTSLPSIGGLPKLKNLCIKEMPKVVEVGVEFYGENTSSVELFPSLETLRIEDMPMWKQWSHPVDSNGGVARIFLRLHKLTIWNCPKLVVTLPTSLPSLEKLKIVCCQHIILKLSHFSSLKTLFLDFISELKNLDEVVTKSMLALESLTVVNCNHLISLWQATTNLDNLSSPNRLEIPSCKNLRELEISGCKNLQQPMSEWKLNRLTSLTKLSILGRCESTNMDSFPDNEGLWLPTSLTVLEIREFENLKSISSGINRLTSLQKLVIEGCAKLEFLPREGLPTTLEHLRIWYGPLLRKKCRENGEYWCFIANIPNHYIY